MNTPERIQQKIYTRESFQHLLGQLRYFKKKIVFTNGVFDLLHPGHVDYLAKASDLGDFFVVGVNSDASVRTLHKGETRPLQSQDARATIIAALGFTHAVIVFDESTPQELIRYIQPDVLVKGADYDPDETDPAAKTFIVGSDIVRAKGGEVRVIELLEGFSTTAIEKKIRG